MNPSMKGFQPKALSSASELRSDWLEKTCVFSEFLPTEFQHLFLISWISICCPFPPTPHPFKDSGIHSPELIFIFIFVLLHRPPLCPTNTHVRVTPENQGGSSPPPHPVFSLGTCWADFLGNSFQLLQVSFLSSSPLHFHTPFPKLHKQVQQDTKHTEKL